MDRIEEGWNIVVSGYSMFQLYTRLKSVKGILKNQNSEVFWWFVAQGVESKAGSCFCSRWFY